MEINLTNVLDELKQAHTVEDVCHTLDEIGKMYLPSGMAMSWTMACVFLDGLYTGIRMVYGPNWMTLSRKRDDAGSCHAWEFMLYHENEIRKAYHEHHSPKLPNAKE